MSFTVILFLHLYHIYVTLQLLNLYSYHHYYYINDYYDMRCVQNVHTMLVNIKFFFLNFFLHLSQKNEGHTITMD